jgi:predicted TPR repeat methyltransferase
MNLAVSSPEPLPRAAALTATPSALAPRPFQLLSDTEVGALREALRRHAPDFAAIEALYPDPGHALRRYGLAAWEAGRLDLAAEAFTGAVSLSPGDAPLWRDSAFVFQGLGRAGEALTCIRRALDLQPGEARSWLMLANLLQQQGLSGEAEAAFRSAIGRDPAQADAQLGLGLLLFERRDLEEAAHHLSAAATLAPDQPLAAMCLGQVLYTIGDYEGAVAGFTRAAGLTTLPDLPRRNFARSQALSDILAGRLADAVAAHPRRAGPDGEDVASLLAVAFGLFSASGERDAAIAVGRYRLALTPGDPVQTYLLDALCGHPHRAAPISYLEQHFDAFAPSFDAKLVDLLGYRVPEQLAALTSRHRRACTEILDLGCGTGLAAAPLNGFGGRLTGVDVAGGMLAEAAKRKLYAELVKAEAVAFLAETAARFDLVFAADMLVYIGDLAPLFAGAARVLRAGGLFCLSIETGAKGVTLQPSGRFAHEPDYVRSLAAADFVLREDVAQDLRLEGRAPALGRLMIFERRG